METSSSKSELKALENELVLNQFCQDVAKGLILISSEEDVKVSDIRVRWVYPDQVSEETVSKIENYFWNRFYDIYFEGLCEEVLQGYYDAWIADCYLQPRKLTEENYLEAVLDVCKRVIQYHLNNDDAETLERFGCKSLCSEVYVDHKDFIEAYKK